MIIHTMEYRKPHLADFSSVQSLTKESCPTLCDPVNRSTPGLPCPSPIPGVYPNSCLLSRWCHSTISSSTIPFSSCPQSFPASGSFPMSQFFASGGQSIGVSASTSDLPMNTQDWSPLGWTGWISLHQGSQQSPLTASSLLSPLLFHWWAKQTPFSLSLSHGSSPWFVTFCTNTCNPAS